MLVGMLLGWAKQRTGSLYPAFDRKLPAEERDKILIKEMLVPADTWFTQEVIANGNHIIIKVNDKVVTDTIESTNRYTKGYCALQQHNQRGRLSRTKARRLGVQRADEKASSVDR